MTTPRTMTQSQFEKHLHYRHKGFGPVEFHDCLRMCGDITIVPDPEPRPDFASMTNAELAVWLAEHDKTTDSSGVRLRLIKRCNIVADKLGMAR